MKNAASPFAASIATGLEEAIAYVRGEEVPGIHVIEVTDPVNEPD